MIPKKVDSPLFDEKLNIDDRVNYLIGAMTLDEKLDCLTTHCIEIPRLGVRGDFFGMEAAHGIEARHDQAYNAGEPEPTTCFPQPIGMSSSFDTELIRECGKAVGEEARALYNRSKKGGLSRWAPTVDMERDPRWGRTEEAYGEDPFLSGEMAGAYVEGMRGEDPFYIMCAATLKHFYANNVENERISTSSSVDERNKYEYYLEPFRRAIKHGAEAVMTSYNEVNGVPSICNEEVLRLLKRTYGLPGHVVCDGMDFAQTVDNHKYFETHAESIAAGLKAGVDGFTDRPDIVRNAAQEALDRGLITEADIDRALFNGFRTRVRLGFYDKTDACPYNKYGESYVNNKQHQDVQRMMADEALVLLKNDGILPIDTTGSETIAVVGPLADTWNFDWYGGIPPYKVTPLDGIKEAFGQSKISYSDGLDKVKIRVGNKGYLHLNKDGSLDVNAAESDAEIFTLTDWDFGSVNLRCSNGKLVNISEEGKIVADRENNLTWFVKTAWNFESIKQTKYVTDGIYRLMTWDGKKVGIDSNGELSILDDDQLFTIEVVSSGIDEACSLADSADAAIVIVGSDPMVNSKEEVDRSSIAFPRYEMELALKVREHNPNTVVVLITNYPYAIRQLQDNIPAILLSPSGAQDLGNAIGRALSGKYSPAGRLPMTWYEDDNQLCDINNYDIISSGHTYRYFEDKPLYPFGYGLSYGRFAYSEPTYELSDDMQKLKISVSLSNIGTRTSDEVVQVYARKERSRVKSPIKQLVGFVRLRDIDPGTSKRAVIDINIDDLKCYDVISQSMVLESSEYTFMIGASSADTRRSFTLKLGDYTSFIRDPFKTTLAIQYDDYRNCILHRGTKGHAEKGQTCVMPGIPGQTEPKQVCENLPLGWVVYRDMQFLEEPRKLWMHYWPRTSGTITFCMIYGEETCKELVIEVGKDEDFDEHLAGVPADFCKIGQPGTLEIEIEGDIRINDFCFG